MLMFKDEIFPAEVGTASFASTDHEKTIKIRIDLKVPIGEYDKISPTIGKALRTLHGTDCGFSQLQLQKELPPYELTFGQRKSDLKSKDLRVKLSAVQFAKQIIIVRRVDKDSGDEEFVLQFHAHLSKNEHNTAFAHNFFQVPAYCRLVQSQTEMFDETQGLDAKVTEMFVRGTVQSVAMELPDITGTESLLKHLSSSADTETKQRNLLRKLSQGANKEEMTEVDLGQKHELQLDYENVTLVTEGRIVHSLEWKELHQLIQTTPLELNKKG